MKLSSSKFLPHSGVKQIRDVDEIIRCKQMLIINYGRRNAARIFKAGANISKEVAASPADVIKAWESQMRRSLEHEGRTMSTTDYVKRLIYYKHPVI